MNEKALLRLMKTAFKGGGVKAWRTVLDHSDTLLISAGFWTVAMPMEQVPGKVLGLLCEWLRRMPLIGEAYLLRGKMEPERLDTAYDVMQELIADMSDTAFSVPLKPTPFYVGDKRALQRRDTRQMMFFSAGSLDLADNFLFTGAARPDGTLAQWRQPDTDVVVWLQARGDVAPERAAVLEQYDCWAQKEASAYD